MNATSAVREFVDHPCGSFESQPISSVRSGSGGAERGAVLLGDPGPDDIIRDGIVGRSTAFANRLVEIELVAPTDSTVLICGETGSGKELIARAVHTRSARRANPFVTVNCAAIPTGLLESELFGHEKGAFTGAVAQRVGRFELANRGTIFLDEIGEAPLELQPKLLRVLQAEFNGWALANAPYRRAAGECRNVNLAEMVDAKRFRADLYYRLNVFPIHVPSLRERRDDIPLLVRHFAPLCPAHGRRIMDRLQRDGSADGIFWPGNIRELQNLIERAVIQSTGERLRSRGESGSAHCRAEHLRFADLGRG